MDNYKNAAADYYLASEKINSTGLINLYFPQLSLLIIATENLLNIF